MEYFTAWNPGAQHLLLQQARIKSIDLPAALGVLWKEGPRSAALSAFFAGKMVPALSEGGASRLPALADAFRELLPAASAGFLCAGEALYLFCGEGFSLYQVQRVFGKRRPACLLSGGGELSCLAESDNLLFVCEGDLTERERVQALLEGPAPESAEALEKLAEALAKTLVCGEENAAGSGRILAFTVR